MNKNDFIEELNKIGITLTESQLNKLDDFYHLLLLWNERINLTTLTEEKDVYLKHFYDSLTLIKGIDLTKELKVLDIGTGAGFPGIVLNIVFPNLKITLLDSLNKRINYLNEIIKELKLDNIETVCMRAEDYTRINREKYDLVVSRAVANLKILTEISFASVKKEGYFIAMKSDCEKEIEESDLIIKNMGGYLERIIDFKLPIENSKRKLLIIKKIQLTSKKYPRKYSEIKKKK